LKTFPDDIKILEKGVNYESLIENDTYNTICSYND